MSDNVTHASADAPAPTNGSSGAVDAASDRLAKAAADGSTKEVQCDFEIVSLMQLILLAGASWERRQGEPLVCDSKYRMG
jgi:hypothetical protein